VSDSVQWRITEGMIPTRSMTKDWSNISMPKTINTYKTSEVLSKVLLTQNIYIHTKHNFF